MPDLFPTPLPRPLTVRGGRPAPTQNQPVLVTRLTSTTSRSDQYCFLWVTSTGSIADQYWSQSPSSTPPPTSLYHKHLHTLHFSPPDRPSVPLLHPASEEASSIDRELIIR